MALKRNDLELIILAAITVKNATGFTPPRFVIGRDALDELKASQLAQQYLSYKPDGQLYFLDLPVEVQD